jgi:hypothetical protein
MCCISARRLSIHITYTRISLLNNWQKSFQFHIKTTESKFFYTKYTFFTRIFFGISRFLSSTYKFWSISEILKNFMTNKFRFWALKSNRKPLVYFFELSKKFYIKSSPKTLKLVNMSRVTEKGAKNSYGSYPTEFVPEVQKSIGSIEDQISH